MSKHITIHVSITETIDEERDQYNQVKRNREVVKLAEMTIRADSVSDAHKKIAAVMDGALPND